MSRSDVRTRAWAGSGADVAVDAAAVKEVYDAIKDPANGSPLSVLFSFVRAAQESLNVLRAEGTMRNHLDQMVEFGEFTRIVHLPEHQAIEQRYRD